MHTPPTCRVPPLLATNWTAITKLAVPQPLSFDQLEKLHSTPHIKRRGTRGPRKTCNGSSEPRPGTRTPGFTRTKNCKLFEIINSSWKFKQFTVHTCRACLTQDTAHTPAIPPSDRSGTLFLLRTSTSNPQAVSPSHRKAHGSEANCSRMNNNGLSPRAGHRRSRSATNREELCSASTFGSKESITPTPSAQHGRFFNDPVVPSRASILPSLGSTSPSPSSCKKGHPKQQPLMKQFTTFRLVALMATALAALLCTRARVASPTSRTSLRAAAVEAQQDRCAGRIEKRRGLGVPRGRQLCAAVLPSSIVESGSSSWFVSAHVDRAPSAIEPMKRLRGTIAPER